MDTRQWLDDYTARLADLQSKQSALEESCAAAGSKASSRDGAVTVTVGPNGGLQNLELGHRACDLGPARLTALILETARTAQRQATSKVVAALEEFGGGEEALRFIRDSIPDGGGDDKQDKYAPEPEHEPAPRLQAPAPQPAARKPRPVDDDEDNDTRPW